MVFSLVSVQVSFPGIKASDGQFDERDYNIFQFVTSKVFGNPINILVPIFKELLLFDSMLTFKLNLLQNRNIV